MNEPPLVSIVTPCFNSKSFIRNCIESVLAQDYCNVEHIIQDSASTDGTLEIIREYGCKVDCVSEKDRGQADGLDRALKRCHGDIILVLNADDMLMPHAARWGVEQMEKYPDMAVIYGDEYIIDENNNIISKCYGPEPYDFNKLFCVEQVPPAQAAFIRRSCLEDVGLGTPPEQVTCPDYEMWVRIGQKYPMLHVPEFVCKYRWHKNSEGRQINVIRKMIEAKRLVIDKVLINHDTPGNIRSLRNRAYAGLTLWGAEMLVNSEPEKKIDIMSGLSASLKGLYRYPNWRNLRLGVNLFLRFFSRLGKLPELIYKACILTVALIKLPFTIINNRARLSDKVLSASGMILFFGGTCGIITILVLYDNGNTEWKPMILSNWLLTISGLLIILISSLRRNLP